MAPYSDLRASQALERVLIDVGQILASYNHAYVLIGGYIPSLLIEDPDYEHIGTTDIDFMLNPTKLVEGYYAQFIQELLDNNYQLDSENQFRLFYDVDLEDGLGTVRIYLDFLKPRTPRIRSKQQETLVPGFRPIDLTLSSAEAFHDATLRQFTGTDTRGAQNTVRVPVVGPAMFLALKAMALQGRKDSKDCYDVYYFIDQYPSRADLQQHIRGAIRQHQNLLVHFQYLLSTFSTPDKYGSFYAADFIAEHGASDGRTIDQLRTAVSLTVTKFISEALVKVE